jgi:DNA repair exonuclease SbcCD ATPase subunit
MDIKFKKLHIENFMSIGEADINLSDRAFTLIEGVNNNENDNARSNGSGKSSIFEALVWTLTGTTMRGNKDVVNFNGNDRALVTLEFIVDNDKFIVTRTKEHSKHKTNLFIEINGVDKSGKGVRDSEKLLAEYLPDLTPSLIGSVIVLGQGLPQKFTNNSPSGRKEVLEKLFKSDFMIQDLKDRILTRKTELNNELRKVQDSKLVALTKLESAVDTINLNNAKLKQLQEQDSLEFYADVLHKEILEIEERQIQLKDEIDTYTIKRDNANTKISSVKIRKAEIIAEIDKDYESTKEFGNDGINISRVALELAKNEFDRVKNIKDICPTCGQKLPEVNKPDLKPYEKAINDALADLGHWNEQLDKIKAEIEKKKVNSTKELEQEITLCEKELLECSLKVDELKNRHSNNDRALIEKRRLFDENMDLQKTRHIQIQQLIDSNKTNEELQDKLNLDIKECEEIETEINNRLGIISKFNTVITRDFRGYLLNDIIVYINSRAKEYCKDVFGTDLIDFSLDGNNLLIGYNNKEYEALSGGERQKVDLIIQFAIRDMLCRHTSFSSNIIVMDEIFDNLDDIGCQKILDLITTKLYDISSIFIISHHGNELNIPYDDKIKIIKDNNGVTRLDS